MAISEQDLIKVRRRFYEDFDFYSTRALKVRSKDKKIVPFKLNTVQERFNREVEDQRRRTGRVRKIILKGRQQGLSTYVGGRTYWRCSQRSANKGMVLAHKADSTKALWEMYQRYHKLVPELLRPSTKYASKKELTFDKLDAGITVATAGGDGVGRGEMFSDVHASELAFWPDSSAAETLSGLLDCVPPTDDTEVYIESTANGYNEFYRIWNEAVQGRGEFEPFFAAWFESPEYRAKVPEGFERTIEEDDLVESLRSGRRATSVAQVEDQRQGHRQVQAGIPLHTRGSFHQLRPSGVQPGSTDRPHRGSAPADQAHGRDAYRDETCWF
jgi:hypothetical protein